MDYEKTIEEVLAGFQEDANRRIGEIWEKIDAGSGSYSDALMLASRAGRAAGKAIGDTLIEKAVSGAADPELTKQLVPRVLHENYKTVTAATEKVQTTLNKKSGINLKAQIPGFNQGRSDGLVKEIVGKEDIKAFAPTFVQQVENASMSIVDESVRQNADFQYKAGLSPKIIRTAERGCCKWCSDLEGTYAYPCDREIYRRHENCRCVVEYDPGNGTVQNAHTKRTYSSDSARYKRIRQDEILKKDPFRDRDVKLQYRQDSTPGRGNIDYEPNYLKKNNQIEIENAIFIHKTYGGDIKLLTVSTENGVKTADYLWNGSLWDLKTPSTEKAADAAIRHGVKQIHNNPGGIMLDFKNNDIDYSVLRSIIDQRMRRNKLEDLDIMVIHGGKVICILRY